MPKNTYFTQGSVTEQNFYEEIVIEAMGIYGTDVYYMPRRIISFDDITNEVIESRFDEAHLIEMYIESAEGFEGEGTLLSKFGVDIKDSVNLQVARRTFFQTLQESQEDRNRPAEGDLIYIPLTKSLFEIKFVEHEQPFYQLKNLPTFKLQCEMFEYSGEDIDTGNPQIDAIQSIHATTTSVPIKITSTAGFLLGEDVTVTFTDSSVASCEVLGWNDQVDPLVINLSSLRFSTTTGDIPKIGSGTTLTGVQSGATADVVGSEDLTTEIHDLDVYDDSADFEALNNNYIDFSEINPFGEPNA
tara:strand:- start:2 stop:904 length:903 start_codon:yes stop_codon:yes gene_type:complete